MKLVNALTSVITSSLANGPLVLRHELGHSIIEVGEEYDGGFAYFGVNAYHDLSKPVPWAHWLSSEDQVQPPRVEQSVMPMQEYPWTLLNVSTPWSITFESSGMYAWHLMKFSLSGLPESSDLRIELDVVDLGWVPRKDIGLDRWLYEIAGSESLDAGLHEIKFVLLNEEREGVAQLCSVEMLELGPEETFISTPGHYGVYPTFSEDNKTTYRPTNDDCLMRSVTTPNFCKVCIEGLWLSLLKNIKLIDSVKEGCERRQASESDQGTSSGWVKTLELELLPLAQFRKDGARVNESYAIRWWKGRQALEEFANQTSIELDDESAVGTYSIDVTFITDEVRVDENDHLTTRDFIHQVKHRCS
ncbi:hypothetical protein H0H92_002510 [Tricholoma furcatifolium]|nr:hypothetical protein H0H92_002510 [Tricholoma furcatifolium]